MENYKLVNGEIIKEETVGSRSQAVLEIKQQLEELKATKLEVMERITFFTEKRIAVQAKIDNLKAFLLSIGE